MTPKPQATRAGLKAESFTVPALDPGIRLFVASRRPASKTDFPGSKIVLFVHGSTSPGSAAFDAPLPGGSWMDFMAGKGFCAYALDYRGYGRSTRPASMDEPPGKNPPYTRTVDAVRDLKAVVDWIRKRHNVKKIQLVAWSWGCVVSGQYAVESPEAVLRLALFAPLFLLDRPRADTDDHYRNVTRESASADRVRDIPPGREEEISPTAWFDRAWAANLATDSKGAKQSPPFMRAPNGTVKDMFLYWSQGKMTYDPAKIRTPVFIITGEWDQVTPIATSLKLLARLGNSPYRRMEILPEATHMALHEKNRLLLFRAVHRFLAEKIPHDLP
ncbi:alpha/beta hydrolase [Deltaproteobacteria bacterium]|nr:alpha/beta hydrolase [Deltaproteobacteria bacterium]